ncbi:MAG: hemerythrin domain-containing protein [Lentisphaerae bacterium]|nr:hemerythrin domain-containing protein [Lentisphaerota bacterium]
MEKFLNSEIKAIIRQYPPVEKVLTDFGIGCGPCSVGSCLLKDIVAIHNLSAEAEQDLLTRIAGIIHPGQPIKLPARQASRPAKTKESRLSPPMQMLGVEHVLIKRLLALIPQLIATMDLTSAPGRQRILEAVDFIRSYADRYHHAKEEDILFKYFDEKTDILKVMRTDHESARGHVRAILVAVERQERDQVAEHLNAYYELLQQHIKKEDEILYPWMDRQLSDSQVGQLFAQFNEANKALSQAPQKYQALIIRLEQAA